MFEILYYIFVYPIYLIIEVLFYFLNFSGFPIWFIIFLISYFVNLISLPMYMAADRMQQEERELQSKMAPRIKSIKENFKGAERYMMIATCYRQNHYHPIMALRKSLSIAIQVPFFMAAYLFFSHLAVFNGTPLLFIKNLGAPDALFNIGSFQINFLPILMTIINVFSALVYSKNLRIKDKVQVFALPLLFLILLYNSPSGLVIYWTFNNLISLIRNLVARVKEPKKCFYILNLIIIGTFIGFLLYLWKDNIYMLVSPLIFLLLLLSVPAYVIIKNFKEYQKEGLNKKEKYLFFLSLITNFVCIGLLINSNLFVSSPLSFPPRLIIFTALQSFGLFIMLPCVLYFFSGNIIRRIVLISSVIFLFLAITNIIGVNGSEAISNIFTFNHEFQVDIDKVLVNLSICWVAIAVVSVLFYQKREDILLHLVLIIFITSFIVSFVNCYNLTRFYIRTKENQETILDPKIHLSKTGKNVIIFMMDRAVNSFLPMIFEEKPELNDVYTGFIYYPNTISYYAHTILGLPPILGGYEYIPEELDKRPEKMVDKRNEALLVLPTIFKNNDFNTLLADVTWADFKEGSDGDLFNRNGIGFVNLYGKYSDLYNSLYLNNVKNDNLKIQKRQCLMYSIFRVAPTIFKGMIYNEGNYLTTERYNYISNELMGSYPVMYFMPKLTDFVADKDTFTFIDNILPHSESFLEYPSYTFTGRFVPGDTGITDTYTNMSYHLNMASLLLIGEFIKYLKSNDVYDNTRIIIVSDHGSLLFNNPKKDKNFNDNIAPFNPILFVKDFNAEGKYKTDNTFMTNADVPLIALKDIVNRPKNPFTHKNLTNDGKQKGAVLFVNHAKWNPSHFQDSKVFEEDSQFIKVKDNIFDEKNYIMNYKYN